MKNQFIAAVIVLSSLFAAVSCRQAVLLERNDWAPDVKQGINDLITLYGNAAGKQYAVFDFDNTSSIFDITENEMCFQLMTMSFEMSPERFSEVMSTDIPLEKADYGIYVNDICSTYSYLYDKYGPFSYKGLSEQEMAVVMADPVWEQFAGKMFSFYSVMESNGDITIAYNWDKYWCCGMTDEQERDLAGRSHEIFSQTETCIGEWNGRQYTLGFTVTENIKELWRVLDANGIDVWVCSASGTNAVIEAIDMFGLRPYCSGVLAMTIGHDSRGRLANFYDYEGRALLPSEEGGWERDTLAIGAQTCRQGKVTGILNAIAPKYGGKGPIACFMDSTGDFNFCTEFADTKLVVCFNRGNRRITDGGGLIAETAIYEREVLGYDLKKANEAGDILFLLQGRDDNGLRSLRPSNATLTLGAAEEKLFAGPENWAQYRTMCDSSMTVKQIIEEFSIPFTEDYPGYRSIPSKL